MRGLVANNASTPIADGKPPGKIDLSAIPRVFSLAPASPGVVQNPLKRPSRPSSALALRSPSK